MGDDETARDEARADAAVDLARALLRASRGTATRAERRRLDRMGRLLGDDDGRELILRLTDEVLRIDVPAAAARRLRAIERAHRTRALGPLDRLALRAGALLAPLLPRLVMPFVVRRIRAETRGIVLPAEDPGFRRHVAQRGREGVRLNVNPLGEAILSDAESAARMRAVIEKIERSDVDYVSVKISSIVANLDELAFEHSVEAVCQRLRQLYRTAEAASPRTFVNLDMEEYRDLELTVAALTAVLDEPEFTGVDAGIVLQAYLPDSHDLLERVGNWAARRRRRGGGRIKVRIVKGANLAMEVVEAELHRWIPAPYGTKAEVDASFKAMLDSALRPEWADSLRIGVASHNLFDVAWALLLAKELDALDRVDFEMLEGMAPAQAREVLAVTGDLLLYAPVVADEDFDASIAYLSRRLDENTQPENFLRALFTLTPDGPGFEVEAERFRDAVRERHSVSTARRRRPLDRPDDRFENEPGTDLTDPANRAAIVDALAHPPAMAPSQVESEREIDAVVARARAAFSGSDHALEERRAWLLGAADAIRAMRWQAIALMADETGKVVRESDPEVDEAIDFCEYYARDGSERLARAAARGDEVAGRGVVVVVAPWNFPYAIPTGGVAGALVAGNSVVLKPAPEAVRMGRLVAEAFWRAGVPDDVLQLVVCEDGPVGQRLVSHPDVDTVVLTGSFETAAMFTDWRPELRLYAETSGKNALVITGAADLDLAIADLVRSAFGHAGQKCSAASLGIITAPVYDDPAFRVRVAEAVRSLRVGPAADVASMTGPVVAAPGGKLRRGLTNLDPGESWLVEPQLRSGDGRMWTPGVRFDVQPGSWFHRTECFGPVLGLMRAHDLDHAIDLQNATDYGLTGGLHSLDPAEIDHWLDRVRVGNAYVNRHTTGAIVRRQPFGGWKRSSVGGGAKAGGPGYVQQFARIGRADGTVVEVQESYRAAWDEWYSRAHDPSGLRAEANVLRYVPLDRVIVRHDGATPGAVEMLRAAADVAGVTLAESTTSDEDDATFAERATTCDRVRLLCPLDGAARRTLHAANVPIDDDPPVADGMLELQRWVREQAVSHTLHRHGRLPPDVIHAT